jgi:hypothetical protein
MPAFGRTMALTQEQIANVEAYILALNGVERGRISRPGIRPVVWLILILAVFAAASLAFVLFRPGKRTSR